MYPLAVVGSIPTHAIGLTNFVISVGQPLPPPSPVGVSDAFGIVTPKEQGQSLHWALIHHLNKNFKYKNNIDTLKNEASRITPILPRNASTT